VSVTVQDAVVTLLALGAVAALVRRLAGVIRPPGKSAGCPSCPSCADGRSRSEADDVAQPLPIVERSRIRPQSKAL
jgi:hypothetical protein